LKKLLEEDGVKPRGSTSRAKRADLQSTTRPGKKIHHRP